MGWTLTKGLNNLRAQTNLALPNRDKTTDGTIGNRAHQLHTSGHNPDDTPGSKAAWDGDPDSDPEVRSWDMDKDLRTPGVTAQDFVDHLIRLPHLDTVIRYLIYDGRIYHTRTGFRPERFAGDPHTDHIHVEGAWTQAGDNNTTFDFRLEELTDMTKDEMLALLNSKDGQAAIAKAAGAGVHNQKLGASQVTIGQVLQGFGTDAGAQLRTLAGKDAVDEQALARDLAARIVPALPTSAEVTQEQLQHALVGALRELAAPAA